MKNLKNNWAFVIILVLCITIVEALESDFNGDGRVDVLVKNNNNGRVNVWLNTASGTTSKYLKVLSPSLEIIDTGDINGDTKTDLIVKNTINGRVNAWLTTEGQSTTHYLKTLNSNLEIISIADINGDNKDDIIVKNITNRRVNAWITTAEKSTNHYLKTLSPNIKIVDIADINGDGKDDIVVENINNRRVNAWISTEGKSINQYLKTLPLSVKIEGVADINGDGKDDIVVKNINNGRVNAWLSREGKSSNQYLKTLNANLEIVTMVDVDGDGKEDIVVENTTNGRVNAWISTATKSTNRYLKTLFTGLEIVQVGDVDGDGNVDIIVQNTNNGRLSAWLNTDLGTTNQYLRTLGSEFIIVNSMFSRIIETCIPSGLPSLVEGPIPHMEGVMRDEHLAALALVDYTEVTHVAIHDGLWTDPNTWHNCEVPTENANVVIEEGKSIVYNMLNSTPLHTVRVDGILSFQKDIDTKIVFDTLFVDGRGTLEIGELNNTITANTELIVADNGDINLTWDTRLQSRGIIAHGTSRMYGESKTTHLKVLNDPLQGDTVLTLSSAPTNWHVGDRIVVTGTFYSGFMWNNDERKEIFHPSQDEVRSIVAINGTNITLDQALIYDHVTPRADLKASISNTTRNITISTENGDSLAPHQRGHMMFMHNRDVDVRYVAFDFLGRTNKEVDSFEVQDIENLQVDSNVRGRYAFHFHRTGVTDSRHPAIAIGNSVFNSPGWGYVQHDSHANFYENVSYNTFGAGFVAEVGNETGVWANNLAIKGKGRNVLNPKNGVDREAFDMARVGSGFWFQGRMVRAVNNIATGFNHGFVYFHRGTGMFAFSPKSFMLPEALQYGQLTQPDDAPIRNFDGNEAYACSVGLAVVKANPNQGHDISTHLSNFKGWEVELGALIEYTSHYLVDNFDLIGNTRERFREPRIAIEFGNNTSDMVIRNARIENFNNGIELSKHFTNESEIGLDQYVIIEPSFSNVDNHYVDFNASQDILINNADLNLSQFSVILNDAPNFEYLNTSFAYDAGVIYIGAKQDSIGATVIPAGTDSFEMRPVNLLGLLEEDGYYRTTEGTPYVIVESYFTDRATGEIHKYGLKTLIGPALDAEFSNTFSSWSEANFLGTIDLNSTAPIATNDSGTVIINDSVIIDLLANDTDIDGDSLVIDGILDPLHGTAYNNDDGSITYSPDFNFQGTDKFYYWVSDQQGNFTKGQVIVTVE